MDASTIFPYVLVIGQLATALVLFRSAQEPRLALRILGVLFLLNAGVTAVLGLPRDYAIWLHSDEGFVTQLFRAFDAPTGALLIAFVLARQGGALARKGAYLMMGLGAVLAFAEFPFHRFMADNEHYVRSVPFYGALGLSCWVLARGKPWERWVCLGFLARALYWGTAGSLQFVDQGLPTQGVVLANGLGLLALMLVSVAASWRLLTGSGGPTAVISIVILLIGPEMALLEDSVRSTLPAGEPFWYGATVVLNLVTLALVRPVVTLAGLSPSSLRPVAFRSFVSGGAGLAAALVAGPLTLVPPHAPATLPPGVGDAAGYGLGLAVAAVVFAAYDAVHPLGAPAAADASHPVGSDSPAPSESQAPPGQAAAPAGPARIDSGGEAQRRPQWQMLILAIRGSSVPEGVEKTGEDRLMQRAISERTGIGAPRISTIVAELTEGAEARLDAYMPGWRTESRSRPEILRQFRGAIPGFAGVWVYYRLTPLGEKLAERIAGESHLGRPGP
ncbi:MAG: hypothetical protein HY556_00245 [Euryarchaeota archaeon]|nr:hypothetical protein [Euryarchaeota archaeon]